MSPGRFREGCKRAVRNLRLDAVRSPELCAGAIARAVGSPDGLQFWNLWMDGGRVEGGRYIYGNYQDAYHGKKCTVTGRDILEELRALDCGPGDRLMVHSSLSSLGYVEGGAETVIKAFMELVTENGVLMMPSFNHFAPFKKGGAGYYSPGETPTKNGVIPDTFWKMRGVYRSLNPSHPFAVWGKDGREYVKNHHKVLTMGQGSPLQLLEEIGGKVLLMGCPGANTFHHVVEMTNNVPCLGKRTREYPVKLPDGRMVNCRTWGWRNGSCPVNDKLIYFKEMEEEKCIKERKIGKSQVLVFEMKHSRIIIERLLGGGRKGVAGCKNCDILPRTAGAHVVESDWDDVKGVKSDTTAFIGDINFEYGNYP